jgi:hypothetical protein
VHRGKKGCLLPKSQERVDSISNSHASRTLPLPLRPGSQNGRRLAFVFILNYRLDCGSANGACRVRPTLAAHRPQTKTCPRKERRGSQTRGLHIPDLRGAQQQELQVRPPERIKGAGGSSIASPSHLHLSRHLVFAIPRETLSSTSDTFRRLLPHRNVTNQGTANPSRPRRVAALPSQLQPAISPQLLGLEWLTKRYCRC